MGGLRALTFVAALAASVAVGPYLGQTPPGMTPVRFSVAGVAPDHSVPVFAPDRVEVYWAQADEPDGSRSIYRAYLSAQGWSAPAVVPFTRRWDGDCPVFAPDGRTLYFISTRPLATEGGLRRERLWAVTRDAAGWSTPRVLPGEINDGHLHWSCSVDAEGNVYFGADRGGGQGSDDIHVSRRTGDRYQPALSLAPPLNTACHESTPFVAPDGSYLLFSRSCFGPDTPDVPTGLLVSFRLADGAWSEPAPVPLAGIPAGAAVCPTVTHDDRFLFFLALGRNQRTLYWVDAAVIWNLDPRGTAGGDGGGR